MVNAVVNLTSASLVVVLFIGAIILATDDNSAWQKFFTLGVYIAIWNILHTAACYVVLLFTELTDDDNHAAAKAIGFYLAGLLLSLLITRFIAPRLIQIIGLTA